MRRELSFIAEARNLRGNLKEEITWDNRRTLKYKAFGKTTKASYTLIIGHNNQHHKRSDLHASDRSHDNILKEGKNGDGAIDAIDEIDGIEAIDGIDGIDAASNGCDGEQNCARCTVCNVFFDDCNEFVRFFFHVLIKMRIFAAQNNQHTFDNFI